MTYRPIRFLFAFLAPTRLLIPLSIAALLAALVVGCATFKNTPKQEYVWDMGRACSTNGAQITRVLPDGTYYATWAGGAYTWPEFQTCMREQFKAHPYADWLKLRQATRPG
jgi:hypothetical protein